MTTEFPIYSLIDSPRIANSCGVWSECAVYYVTVAPLAQRLEQRPFKSWVQGSNPWGGHRFSSRVSLRILSRISLRSNVIPKALTRISVAFHSPSPAPVPFVVECPHAISGLEDRSHWPPGNPSARKIRRTMTRRIRQPQWSAWTDAACARFRNGRGLAWRHARWVTFHALG